MVCYDPLYLIHLFLSRSPVPCLAEAERAEAEGVCTKCVVSLPEGWQEAGEDAAEAARAGRGQEAAGPVCVAAPWCSHGHAHITCLHPHTH